MKNDKYYMKPHTVVKIREDLKKGQCGINFVTHKMLDYKGQITSIVDTTKTDEGYLYSISADSGRFWWTEEMLENETYPLAMLLANELGLTYDEIVSDYKNNMHKDVVNNDELEQYIKDVYGKLLF